MCVSMSRDEMAEAWGCLVEETLHVGGPAVQLDGTADNGLVTITDNIFVHMIGCNGTGTAIQWDCDIILPSMDADSVTFALAVNPQIGDNVVWSPADLAGAPGIVGMMLPIGTKFQFSTSVTVEDVTIRIGAHSAIFGL